MYTYFHQNFKQSRYQRGSALVISLIILAILAALGIASLDVATINIFISANDRDRKDAFFHADSGVNIGHEFLEEAHYDVNGNSTFYDNDANVWQNVFNSSCGDSPGTPKWGDCTPCTNPEFLTLYPEDEMATYVRAGRLGSGLLEGSAMQIGAGYEGIGKSVAHGGTFTNYLIRSKRYGQRNSLSEVDLGWRHIER